MRVLRLPKYGPKGFRTLPHECQRHGNVEADWPSRGVLLPHGWQEPRRETQLAPSSGRINFQAMMLGNPYILGKSGTGPTGSLHPVPSPRPPQRPSLARLVPEDCILASYRSFDKLSSIHNLPALAHGTT
jgi:hypothetical protein